MCLSKITKNYKNSVSGVGYQLFRASKDKLYPAFSRCHGFRRSVPIKKEIKANTKQIKTLYGDNYACGFHVFKKKKDAERYLKRALEFPDGVFYKKKNLRLFRVEYRKPSVAGTENPFGIDYKIIVCKYRTIIEEVNC